MQKVILKVLKGAGVTNAFPAGQIAAVDLYCGAEKSAIEAVYINSSYAEFATPGTGRVRVAVITCGLNKVYALGNVADLKGLQNCCSTKKNLTLSLACPAIPPVTVYSITGEDLGTATTPLQYVTKWNANANNQILGTLYTGNGWKFNLSFNVGNYMPSALACDASTTPVSCPSITFASVTSSSVTVNWTAVAGATNYKIDVKKEGQTTGFPTTTSTGLTASFSSLQAGTLYHVTVSPFIGGAFVTTCPSVDFTTTAAAAASAALKWGWSTTDPYVNDTTAPIYNLLGSLDPLSPGATLSTNFSSMPSQKYAVVEYPATESNKTTWADSGSGPNAGTIPDAATRAIFTVNGRKYIVFRNPIDFDTNPASRVVFS